MDTLRRVRRCTLAIIAVLAWSPLMAQGEKNDTRRVVEIRSYNLKPGTRERFQQLFLREALPMLQRWKIDVVAFGPSLHDGDSFYLMRAYSSVADRQRSEDAFYGSDEWKKGPREAILAAIDSYATTVISVDEATLRGLRMTDRSAPVANDLTTLLELNLTYVRSVQTSDVQRFREILADDFLCSNPDGSLVDREKFLEQTARPVAITDLAAHDVDVRIMGDVAIVHARTTYTGPDGRPGEGRYTDVWARRNGRWLAVSAHVTRR
jgi:ketosteroid isomerase-like protein